MSRALNLFKWLTTLIFLPLTQKGAMVTRIKVTKYFGTLFNKWKILAIFALSESRGT